MLKEINNVFYYRSSDKEMCLDIVQIEFVLGWMNKM